MSNVRLEAGLSGIGPGEVPGVEVPVNLFSTFVDTNVDSFNTFNGTLRELRETKRAWEQALHPQVELALAHARREYGGLPGRLEDRIRMGISSLVVDLDGPDVDRETPLVFNVDRGHSIVLEGELLDFRHNFRDATAPMVAELHNFQIQIHEEMVAQMGSNYDFLVDTREFLVNPKYGQQRELASGIFRNISAVEGMLQTKAQPGVFSSIRIEWQSRAQELETAYNPTVFKRFWESEKSNVTDELIEYIRFGALMAKVGRDEAGNEPPTTQDLLRSIGRLPIETWPKKLREAYLVFYKSDSAMLVATISSKIRELFPKSTGRNNFVSSETTGSSKRRHHASNGEEEVEGVRGGNGEPEGSSGKEAEAKGFKLAILKKDPEGKFSHKVYPILAEEVEEVIQGLANAGSDEHDMREDIVEILRSLIKSPYQPGTKRLSKPPVYFSVDGHHKSPFRRFDPNGMKDVTFKNPQTWRLRVIYGVIGDVVMLRKVMSHDVFDSTDPSKL